MSFDSQTPLDQREASRFRRALRAWYAQHARDLPWRRVSDPYKIWISEIMLQQTTVVAVVPYFERFMARFPTVVELAAATEGEVLRFWEGLGYYSRARNIHLAARKIVAEQGGEFPTAVAELIQLPGIGRYTAGAIASFAFDRRAPIVEANTLRLYSRLLGLREDPRSRLGQETLWEFATEILPQTGSGLLNQALMELGATVCKPNQPDCERCPVQKFCVADALQLQDVIPLKLQRPEITQVTEVAIAVRRQQDYLLCRCKAGERWAGLWDFPRYAYEPADKKKQAANLAPWAEQMLKTQLGIQVAPEGLVKLMRHSVTRYRITLLCISAEYLSGDVSAAADEFVWVSPNQFDEYPLSVTGRKFAHLLIQLTE